MNEAPAWNSVAFEQPEGLGGALSTVMLRA
jgi:hypothetical protein